MVTYVQGYCHQCDSEKQLIQTVSWQSNCCRSCGSTNVEVRAS